MSTIFAVPSVVLGAALNVGVIIGNEVTPTPTLTLATAHVPVVTTLDPASGGVSVTTAAALEPFEVVVETNEPVSLSPDSLDIDALVYEPVVALGGLAGPSSTVVFSGAHPVVVALTPGILATPDEVEGSFAAFDPEVLATSTVSISAVGVEVDATALVPDVVLTDGSQPPLLATFSLARAHDPLVAIYSLIGGDTLGFTGAALDGEVETTQMGAIAAVSAEVSATSGVATVSFDTDVAAPTTPQVVAGSDAPTVLATVEQLIASVLAEMEAAALLPEVAVLPGTNQVSPLEVRARARPVFVYAEGPEGVPQYAEVNVVWSPITTEVALSSLISQTVTLESPVAKSVVLETTLWEDGLVIVEAVTPPKPPKPPFDPEEPELPPGG